MAECCRSTTKVSAGKTIRRKGVNSMFSPQKHDVEVSTELCRHFQEKVLVLNSAEKTDGHGS